MKFFVGKNHDGHKFYVTVELRRNTKRDQYETIEHNYVSDYVELSMTYDETGPRGRDIGGGAGVPGLLNEVTLPQHAQFRRMVELADRYHLNGMRAGCAHQKVVWEDAPYRRPSLELTKPCPKTGYKYGHAWLVEPLPQDVIDELTGWGVPITDGWN